MAVHLSTVQSAELRELLTSMPYANMVHLDIVDVVDGDTLLLWLATYKPVLESVAKEVATSRDELRRHREFVDSLRRAQRVINQLPGEKLAGPQ